MVLRYAGTWHPDTCNCIIEQEYDDEDPQPIKMRVRRVVFKCPEHQNLSTDSSVFAVVNDENPRRNNAMRILLDNAPTTIYELDQNGMKIFRSGITVDWSYSGTVPNRVLTLTITGISLSANQRNVIQNRLNERFGISNVVIVN